MGIKVLTNKQMRAADKYTIEEKKIPSLLLMERAGEALAKEVTLLAPSGDILCVCGGGNNGGDGFVCARLLKEVGRAVEVVCLTEKFSNDCAINKRKWQEMEGVCLAEIPQKEYALMVDCLFGTGFHGALDGAEKSLVEEMNARKKEGCKILSADIPSGVNGENGRVDGVAVCADITLCIGEIKTGVLLNDGIDYAGKIKRADIGILLPEKECAILTDRRAAKELLPIRKRNSHKGTFGRAAIVAGSEAYSGAAYLAYAAAVACLRSGAGYTTLYTPKDLISSFRLKAPEILLKETNEGGMYAFNEEVMADLLPYDSIAYGMGMGVSEEVFKGAEYLLERYEGRLILDADGLNSLALFSKDRLFNIFKNKKCDVILTPHVKEFSRLTAWTVEEIVDNGLAYSQQFAKELGVTLLLKNAVSIVTDGERTAINRTGNSGQAKGGTGDTLAGTIAGLCAMGLSAYEGGVLAAYLVGKSAELAAKDMGEYSLTATDLIAYLPKAFLFVTEDTHEDGAKQ